MNNPILIAGVDEVGRGAWAGPMVAAAVILIKPIEGLRDSKKLTATARERLSALIRSSAIWSIAEVSPQEIDRLGLTEANRLVMRQAIRQLSPLPTLVRCDGFSCQPDIMEEVHVHGDDLFPEISAASIMAKVYRDQLMHKLHQQDSRYAFDQHVGYGTKLHQARLKEFGPSPWHRHSFTPIQQLEGTAESA